MDEVVSASLAHWLLEQIAADEEVARAANRRIIALDEAIGYYDGDPITWRDWSEPVSPHVALGSVRDHIARWDPARVLAECDSKRRIVERCRLVIDSFERTTRHLGGYIAWTDVNRREKSHAWNTLYEFTQPYADRPGFRDEWRV